MHNSKVKTVGERMDEALSKAGYTQTTMARELGVSRATVNQWCTNTNTPKTVNLVKFCVLTDSSIDYILNGE